MKNKTLIIFIVVPVLIYAVCSFAFANEWLFYKEVNLIGGYSDRDGWVDRSSDQVSSIGFEDYRKFSGDFGDYLTTDLQLRAAYDNTAESSDSWGVQIHNAWLLYKLVLGTNLRFGHFDPAFGLEPQVDTHSTILQTLAMRDIGFNKDWGIGIEGSLSKFDYKTALQIGSGMSINRIDSSFLWTGRVGTPATQNFQYGLSLLCGRVLESMGMNTFPRARLMSDEAILMKRAGVDVQYLYGPFLLKGEIAYGSNDDNNVLGYLGELDYTFPKYQNVELEFQYQSWINDLNERSSDDSTLSIGASYRINQEITIRAVFSCDFNMVGQEKENKALVQFYYFG
jgi:hypothetical protein